VFGLFSWQSDFFILHFILCINYISLYIGYICLLTIPLYSNENSQSVRVIKYNNLLCQVNVLLQFRKVQKTSNALEEENLKNHM